MLAKLIILDLNFLAEEVCGNYLENVLEHLKSCPNDVLDLVKQSILQGSYALEALQPLVINSIVETVVLKSAEELRQMKGITATYRVTNGPLPVRHSPYVSGVLHNLKVFLEGERTAAYLSGELQKELLQSAAYVITRLYHGLAAELVSNTRKTENSLQRIRMGAQRRVGASSDVSDHNMSVTDKEYGRNLAFLVVDVANIPDYHSLWQCVAPSDSQNTISF